MELTINKCQSNLVIGGITANWGFQPPNLPFLWGDWDPCLQCYLGLHQCLPRRQSPSIYRHCRPSPSPVVRHKHAGHHADEPVNSWGPRISSGCIASMERPTRINQDCSGLDVIPPAAQDVPVLQQLLLTFFSWPLRLG